MKNFKLSSETIDCLLEIAIGILLLIIVLVLLTAPDLVAISN